MISIRNLTKTYCSSKQIKYPALKDINLTINDGELVAVIGPSGAGKSTLLHILAGIDTPTTGVVKIDNVNIGKLSAGKLARVRNGVTSIVLQDFALLDEFTVFDNVLMPLYFSRGGMKAKKQRVTETLQALHIFDLSKKYVNQLSGGQKQRVAIARALVTNPKYIFADEPTGALDSSTSEEIMNILLELNRQKMTVVIVTHNMDIANKCKRIIQIKDGFLVGDSKTET